MADSHGAGRTAANTDAPSDTETATLGGGCFWCLEALLKQLPGVMRAVSGYAGGDVANPTYDDVCRGNTGHAEVVRIEFDPARSSYEAVLRFFFQVHDPTTPNRQGPDIGTQYRSIILYHTDAQRDAALALIEELDASGIWPNPIVTEVEPAGQFYEAEHYHQDYYRRNRNATYCRAVIEPKLRAHGAPQ